ncbi:hypothetical protein BC835DRAFT_1396217 [Cytidiella melzeri]|nr:hypothetical protein BC835DRAFT_1396217 [Cytidiella melzeri]
MLSPHSTTQVSLDMKEEEPTNMITTPRDRALCEVTARTPLQTEAQYIHAPVTTMGKWEESGLSWWILLMRRVSRLEIFTPCAMLEDFGIFPALADSVRVTVFSYF